MDKYINGFAEQAAILQSIRAGIREQIRVAHWERTACINLAHSWKVDDKEISSFYYKRAEKYTDKIKRLERNLKWVKEAIRECHEMEHEDKFAGEVL